VKKQADNSLLPRLNGSYGRNKKAEFPGIRPFLLNLFAVIQRKIFDSGKELVHTLNLQKAAAFARSEFNG
jgi:hypothetical protein